MTIKNCLSMLEKKDFKVEFSTKHSFKIYAKTKKDLKLLSQGNYPEFISLFRILLEQNNLRVDVEWRKSQGCWIVMIETPTEWKPIEEFPEK